MKAIAIAACTMAAFVAVPGSTWWHGFVAGISSLALGSLIADSTR